MTHDTAYDIWNTKGFKLWSQQNSDDVANEVMIGEDEIAWAIEEEGRCDAIDRKGRAVIIVVAGSRKPKA